MGKILDALFRNAQAGQDEPQPQAGGDTKAYVKRIQGQLNEARRDFPTYRKAEEFVQAAKNLVERSKMILSQQGQAHLSDIASLNFATALKEHQIGLERELQLEKLGYQATELLHSVDITVITVSAIVEKFQAIQRLGNPLLTKLMIPVFAAMLTDFIRTSRANASLMTHDEAVALLTAPAVEVNQRGEGKPFRPNPDIEDAEFWDVADKEDYRKANGSNGK